MLGTVSSLQRCELCVCVHVPVCCVCVFGFLFNTLLSVWELSKPESRQAQTRAGMCWLFPRTQGGGVRRGRGLGNQAVFVNPP